MWRQWLTAIALGAALASGGASAATEAPSPVSKAPAPKVGSAQARFGLTFAPVAFEPPQVNLDKLPNGILARHCAEMEVPMATVLVRVGVGSINDPAGKVGAAEMTGEVIRTGGSEALPGDALDRELESRGAELSVETTREETWFRLSILPEDLEWGMRALAGLLARPRLPGEKLAEARARADVDLHQRLDVPMDAARALFPQLIFGKGNPWGWTKTEKTLGRLTVDDLKATHKRFYQAPRIELGLSGAVTRERARDLAERYFGLSTFPAVAPEKPVLPKAPPVAASRVYVVQRPVTQAVVYVGHEGIGRFAPEKFPVKLFNEVLSGGFSSRLTKQVRVERGLAYLVYGMITEGTSRGIFYNVALTKVASTLDALQVMMQVDRDLRQAPPSPDEVQTARQSTINSFVFLFDSAEQIVRQQMTLDAFGYPADYLATYVGHLKDVTGEQIRDAARKDIHLDRAIVLVFGSVDARMRAELAKIGPVTEISEDRLRADWL
jgi:predicted Zn-dependent peptidase